MFGDALKLKVVSINPSHVLALANILAIEDKKTTD
jgi:hypothetical protein